MMQGFVREMACRPGRLKTPGRNRILGFPKTPEGRAVLAELAPGQPKKRGLDEVSAKPPRVSLPLDGRWQ